MDITWTLFFSDKTRLAKFIILTVISTLTVHFFTDFMMWNETRPGHLFDDPILKLFSPINISLITSFLLSEQAIRDVNHQRAEDYETGTHEAYFAFSYFRDGLLFADWPRWASAVNIITF